MEKKILNFGVFMPLVAVLAMAIATIACGSEIASTKVGEDVNLEPIETLVLTLSVTQTPTQLPTKTPTAMPTTTPAPFAFLTVSGESVNLRNGPGKNYGIIGNAKQGDELPVYARNEDGSWLQINWVEQTWIVTSLITLDQDISTIPLAPTPAPTNTPTEPPTSTNTSTPTDTPIPTITSTATPPPLTFADIEYNKDHMTDLQWEEYRRGIIGKRVHWTATVTEVDEDGDISLDMGQNTWRSIYLEGVSRDILLTINKHATIEFEATISDEYTFVFWYLKLSNPKIISIK